MPTDRFGLTVAQLKARRSGFAFSASTDVTEDAAYAMLEEAEAEVCGFLIGAASVPTSALDDTTSTVHKIGRGWSLEMASIQAGFAVGMLNAEQYAAASSSIRKRMENYRVNPSDLGDSAPTGDDVPGRLLTQVSQRDAIRANKDSFSDRLHRRNRSSGSYR